MRWRALCSLRRFMWATRHARVLRTEIFELFRKKESADFSRSTLRMISQNFRRAQCRHKSRANFAKPGLSRANPRRDGGQANAFRIICDLIIWRIVTSNNLGINILIFT